MAIRSKLLAKDTRRNQTAFLLDSIRRGRCDSDRGAPVIDVELKRWRIQFNPSSPRRFLRSFDYLIRPLEHADRNCQTNLFRGLQVDNEFKFRCLLHRQVGRFRSLEDLVDVVGSFTGTNHRSKAAGSSLYF